MPFSARDDASIVESIKRSDVVINLIGKHYETKHIVPTRRADGRLCRINYGFDEVHVDIARRIARLSKEAGVKSLIHVSALSADLDSKSAWSRTKAQGELAVREEFPEAVIVKPATLFGHEDRFLNWIGESLKRLPKKTLIPTRGVIVFPLLNGGENLVQPVWSGDVAKAVSQIIFVSINHVFIYLLFIYYLFIIYLLFTI